ncbi:MAG: ABC transporter permease [Thermomicrobiales bacterium]
MHSQAPSSPRMTIKRNWMIALDIALLSGKSKVFRSGPLFYIMVWSSFPIFSLLSVALIYRNDERLRDYAVVAGSASAFIFLMIYGAGQMLDEERQRGTLGALFLAPAHRFTWLGGFQLMTLAEMLFSATISLTIGSLIFGVDLSVNISALVVSLMLFCSALWGLSMIIGSIGVAIRDANQLSNLLFNVIVILAGTMIPIDRLPDWLQIPARCLPFGYGMEAIVGSLANGSSIGDLQSSLWPLAGFAIVLPILGTAVFRVLEQRSRAHGALEFI